jgi:hypothetical protein
MNKSKQKCSYCFKSLGKTAHRIKDKIYCEKCFWDVYKEERNKEEVFKKNLTQDR